jgi:hypothetical protein
VVAPLVWAAPLDPSNEITSVNNADSKAGWRLNIHGSDVILFPLVIRHVVPTKNSSQPGYLDSSLQAPDANDLIQSTWMPTPQVTTFEQGFIAGCAEFASALHPKQLLTSVTSVILLESAILIQPNRREAKCFRPM